jgi:excisionase family DNA binding protein
VKLEDLAGRLTCTVPEAGQLLGIGRDAAYAAAARGEIPTLRLGRTLRVSIPRLLELCGTTPDMSADPATTTGPNTTTEPVEGAYTHGDTSTLRAV